MKQILRRTIASLLIASFLIGNVGSIAKEALAATLSSTETEEAVTLQNEYVELSVNKKNAGYVLKTREGDILTKTDNNKPLNYRGGEGDTSFATIRIDGKNYIYGNTKNGGKFLTKPYIDADKIISTWTQGDICVKQTLSLLTDSQEEKLGAVKIDYTVWNTNDASTGTEGTRKVGARLVLDTQLGAQDYAVYEMAPNDVNGTYIQYTRETSIDKADMSAHFRSLDNNYQPRVVAYGYPDDSGIRPDRMVFGHWYSMAENLWDYELNGYSFVDTEVAKYKTADSAVAMFWNESELAADAKRTYSFYYGIQSNEDVGEADSVKLSVSMDKDYFTLNEDKNGYVDDEVKLQVFVSNTLPNSKTRPRMAVKLAIDNDYLKILSADGGADSEVDTGKDVIFMSNFKKGQTRVINWTVKVKNLPETIRYFKYMVKAYTFNDQTEEESSTSLLDSNVIDSVKRNILAPGISGQKPSIGILAGLPDELYYRGNRTFVVRGDGLEILASDKTEWQLKMTDMQTGEESFIDSTNIAFNSDGTAMLVNFTEQMHEGEYQLTILPGTNLTDEQVGLPESITSDEMKFFMSSDEDLINPPVGGVGIRKDESSGTPKYVIDIFKSASETADAAKKDEYMLTFTGNLYQNAADAASSSKFIPVQGSGKDQSIMINKVVSFSGEEMIIDYLYDGDIKKGVQVKMEGDAGVVGGSSKVWNEESEIVLKDGTDYSLDADEVEEGFSEPVEMQMTGIAGIVQKISGFIVDLKYGVFNKRNGSNTISFGGSLSVGFMSVDQYDGVDGVDLFSADVQDVRYGERGFIGVKANSFVGVPQFISTLPADLEGSLAIDTIDYPYLVNVAGEGEFATFKAEFELEIIASKEHGVPVPNIMSLSVGGVKPGAPIILPVAPVVYLQGASGRIDGLYSLFYPSETGGWPDTNITLAGQLSIIDVFSGWVGVSLGTSQASVYGEKMKILGLDFLKTVSGNFRWYPEVSFRLDAQMEILKVIKGEVSCYLLLAGDNAPDLDVYGRVAIVLPSAFFGEDFTVVGVGIGGNKTKLYGTTTFLGSDISFVYYWGDKSLDIDVDLFAADVGTGESAGSIGLNNIHCVAKSKGDLAKEAGTYVSRARAVGVGSPTVNVNEDGELVVSGMESFDTMIRAYYDMQGKDALDISDVKVAVNGDNYSLTGIKLDDEGVATNMEEANYTSGTNELGDYVIITIPKEKMTGDVVISSDVATFSYGEAMIIGSVITMDSISAEVESDSLNVSVQMSNTENATGSKEVYLSETADGDRAYPILVEDENGNSYGLDTDTSALDIPYYVPSGDYYVTTVIRGQQDGRDFQAELTTTEQVTIVNDLAPTTVIKSVTAVSSGDGNALITLDGYDSALMDGIYIEADRTNSDGTITEGYQALFVENKDITNNSFEIALSPEESGNDYTFTVAPMKNIAGDGEEAKYALGYETKSSATNIPYPDAAEITVSYGEEYVEEEKTLGSGEDAVKYNAKVFTSVPADGIKIDAFTDKAVTGKILLDDEIISEITVPGTEFPSCYAKLGDGEHSLRIETKTTSGDTKIVDESIVIDTTAPILQLFTPETGSVVEDGKITLSGQTEPGMVLTATINGIAVDIADVDTSTGTFEVTVDIPQEVSQDMLYELVVKVADAYGRETIAKASLMNPDMDSIESVYLAFDGEKITEDTLSVKGKTSGKLTLYGVTESGSEMAISEDAVLFMATNDGESSAISVDSLGNVTITGEGTAAVAAQYYVTEDYCYQADVLLDSNNEQMKSSDAKEPVISKNLVEETICVTAGEEFTLSVDASSRDSGEITYTWYQKSADGEFRSVDTNSKDFVTTLEDKGTIHQYYVAITNKIRTTGIEEAMVTSPIVTVYVKDDVSKDDLQLTGNSVSIEETEYYAGDIIVNPKEEGVQIALVNDEENQDTLEWKDSLTLSGSESGEVSYKVALRKNGQYISEAYNLIVSKDNTEPEGTITLGESVWNKLLSIITFGIYKSDRQTLQIAAEDACVGMADNGIAYYKTTDSLNLAKLQELSEDKWTTGTQVSIEKDEAAVVYARFKDKLGNTNYISSDGIVVGNVAPVAEFKYDSATLIEGTTHKYKAKADVVITVKDDAVSNGLSSVSYRVNDGEEIVVDINDNQASVDIPVTVSKKGINTISVTATDGYNKTATISSVIEIYSVAGLELRANDDIVYDGRAIEAGTDIVVSNGGSSGSITYSYREGSSGDYEEGLPTDAGTYEIKAVITQDDANYYTSAETVISVEIQKAAQVLEFSSDCYKPVIGNRFVIIVGGVDTTGAVEFEADNSEVIRIITDEFTYDEEGNIASVPAEVLVPGNATVTVKAAEDKNHKYAEKTVNVQVNAEVTDERPYIVEGVVGNNGWYTSDVSIKAADGYGVSAVADGEFSSSYAVAGEGLDKAPESLYFKNALNEVKEVAIEDEINIDMTAPNGEMKAGNSIWRQFLNTITFGLFFKDTVVVSVEATDAVSGMESTGFYKAMDAMTVEALKELNDNDWVTDTVRLEPDSKAVVYARLTDKAGNVTYLSTDGIIVDKTNAVINVATSYDEAGWITSEGATATVTVNDVTAGIANDGITYQIDGGTVYSGAESFTIEGLGDGVHNILITAVDKAGNNATETVTWKQDTVAPTVTLTKESKTSIGIATTAGVSGIAEVKIALNGGELIDITETYADGYTITEGGTYEVRLTTNAGVTVSKTIQMDDIRNDQDIIIGTSTPSPSAPATDAPAQNTGSNQEIASGKDVYNVVYGQKPFSLGAVSDKGTQLTYVSSNTKVVKVNSNGKVTITGCGEAEIVIRAAESAQYKAAEKKVVIRVAPKQVKLKSATSKKAKTMVITWKRDKKASGYQITYATNKKFKKAKSFTVKKNKITKFTIKKLAKKGYYVKVRAFKKSNGKTIYGAYSKAKRVKVK